MFGQTAQHGKMIQAAAGVGSRRSMVRQVVIIGLVAVVLLVIAWWRYESELSAAASIPAPVEQSSVKTLSPEIAPSTSSQVQSTTLNQTATPPVTKTQLKVNDQVVPVPDNGTVSQTVQSPDGNSTVHFSVNSSSNGSNNTSSSTDIQVDSSSSSQVVTNDTN